LRLDSTFAILLIAAGLGLNAEQPGSMRPLSPVERAILEFLFLRITKEANREIGEPLVRFDRVLSWIPREADSTNGDRRHANRPHPDQPLPLLATGRWLRAAFRIAIGDDASFVHLYVSGEALDSLIDWHRSSAARKNRLRFA